MADVRSRLSRAKCVCDAVAVGESVVAGCRRARVSRATFYRWAGVRPDVADLYQRACRARLASVESELRTVREEIAEIQATVPDERPRGGVPFRVWLRAVSDLDNPGSVWRNIRPRMSRRAYRRKRQRMRGLLVLPRLRWEALRLERARLLRRLK